MPSPVRISRHGEPHILLAAWSGIYRLATPGIIAGDNSTVRLGPESEPQPDALLLIPRELGGGSEVDADGCVAGPPDLAAEVAASTASCDLHVKLDVYREHGVREYIVWRMLEGALDWFVLRDGEYVALPPGPDGILRSEVFPGLWLDPAALLSANGARMLEVSQQGAASAEHAGFVQRLAQG